MKHSTLNFYGQAFNREMHALCLPLQAAYLYLLWISF